MTFNHVSVLQLLTSQDGVPPSLGLTPGWRCHGLKHVEQLSSTFKYTMKPPTSLLTTSLFTFPMCCCRKLNQTCSIWSTSQDWETKINVAIRSRVSDVQVRRVLIWFHVVYLSYEFIIFRVFFSRISAVTERLWWNATCRKSDFEHRTGSTFYKTATRCRIRSFIVQIYKLQYVMFRKLYSAHNAIMWAHHSLY